MLGTRLNMLDAVGVVLAVGTLGCGAAVRVPPSYSFFDGARVPALDPTDHRVLASADGSVLENELNLAAANGFRLQALHVSVENEFMANATVVRDSSPGRFSYLVLDAPVQEFDGCGSSA